MPEYRFSLTRILLYTVISNNKSSINIEVCRNCLFTYPRVSNNKKGKSLKTGYWLGNYTQMGNLKSPWISKFTSVIVKVSFKLKGVTINTFTTSICYCYVYNKHMLLPFLIPEVLNLFLCSVLVQYFCYECFDWSALQTSILVF